MEWTLTADSIREARWLINRVGFPVVLSLGPPHYANCIRISIHDAAVLVRTNFLEAFTIARRYGNRSIRIERLALSAR